MDQPVWSKFLTARDTAVFHNAGYGSRQEFGNRPVLLVIDVNYAFYGDKREPILDSIKRWRNSWGEDVVGTAAIPNVDGNDIIAEIAPGPHDIVIRRQKPSVFFGTNLTSYLTLPDCHSLIVTGTTTSGCVRASVVDASSLNYRVSLAEEGCFDRSQASHATNLCDMNAKYADVVKTSEVLPSSVRCPQVYSICSKTSRRS